MSDKSYLKNQIKLMSLNANDTFTEDEWELYMKIVFLVNQIDQTPSGTEKKELVAEKKKTSTALRRMIANHRGFPRKVRLESVCYHKPDEDCPDGVTWQNLKLSKKITEFESDMSRAMGLSANDYTFDKIIIKWKNIDILEQLVVDGFVMELLIDGRIIQKKYRCFTAGAAQLRRDKVQFISEEMWLQIRNRIECGLSWEYLNSKKGCNITKMMSYLALPCSATDPWDDFDIDRAIVIPDWEGEVTGEMMFIFPDYTTETGVRTVKINHVDGAGMILPRKSRKNFMFRGIYFKGLLCVFDFIRFCEAHGVPPIIKDRWGLEHDLVKENIEIIFTDSQFKMARYFDSWDHYKREFKKNGCKFGKTQYEEDYIPDKKLNYQMLGFEPI